MIEKKVGKISKNKKSGKFETKLRKWNQQGVDYLLLKVKKFTIIHDWTNWVTLSVQELKTKINSKKFKIFSIIISISFGEFLTIFWHVVFPHFQRSSYFGIFLENLRVAWKFQNIFLIWGYYYSNFLAFSLSWDIFWAFLMTILGFSGISEFYRICGFSVIFFQFFIAIFAIFGNWLFSCPLQYGKFRRRNF